MTDMGGQIGSTSTPEAVEAFMVRFESCSVTREEWTHLAHLTAGYWYVRKFGATRALDEMRARIRRHNESVGTANTDSSGYHETITCLYLAAIAEHLDAHQGVGFSDGLRMLLESGLASSQWPLQFYSRERLFSAEARRSWVEPSRL
ncbi:MAG: hypothetical protein RL030_2735 [Pseudomonadota bacterium]|jgi:hypothetical protein